MKLDTQQVEIVGRNLLVSLFVADDVEIAEPIRDRGVDIIAYKEISEGNKFHAVPVQLKAFSKEGFGVYAKYEKFPGILMAYVWHAAEPLKAELFVMTYVQALEIADAVGWTKTVSWLDGGGYSTSSPSKELKELLEQYRHKPGSLLKLVSNV